MLELTEEEEEDVGESGAVAGRTMRMLVDGAVTGAGATAALDAATLDAAAA